MQMTELAYEIEVLVCLRFDAWHSLPTRPELHRHTWEIGFSVAGPLNPETGMVCDMLVLSDFFKPFVDELDGINLHEFSGFLHGEGLVALAARYPTCDTLAHYFLQRIQPEFVVNPEFEGLRITGIRISVQEPENGQMWGQAVIKPV